MTHIHLHSGFLSWHPPQVPSQHPVYFFPRPRQAGRSARLCRLHRRLRAVPKLRPSGGVRGFRRAGESEGDGRLCPAARRDVLPLIFPCMGQNLKPPGSGPQVLVLVSIYIPEGTFFLTHTYMGASFFFLLFFF